MKDPERDATVGGRKAREERTAEAMRACGGFACLAGWSLVLTALSLAVVPAAMIGIALKGLPVDWGALASCLFVHVVVWISSVAHGAGEAFDADAGAPPVLSMLCAARAALFALGLSWALWGDARHLEAAVAIILGGAWLGAVVEGVGAARTAQVLQVPVWSAVRISMKAAGRGARRGIPSGAAGRGGRR